MAEDLDVSGSLRKLKSLPEQLHWFCPRNGLKDDTQYYPEDGYDPTQHDEREVKKRSDAIEETRKRRDLVTTALVIFAFDGDDALTLQSFVADRLDTFLSSCDVCVRQFHRSRGNLKQFLLSQYDEEDVTSFFAKYDALSVERIIKRLAVTKEILTGLEPSKRGIQALGTAEIFAIFEVLSCDPFLRNTHLLKQHFDEPFQLVQTKRYLKLAYLLPASTEFLFSEPGIRYNWAKSSWEKLKQIPTRDEFEWCIKGPLFRAMMRVQNYNLDAAFLPQFWASARMIVSHLDKDLITHSLRAMDCDIVKLALEHMQVDTDAFPDMVGTLQTILEMSPGDFWESMGSVGAPDVINAIFSSPALQRMLRAHGQETGVDGKAPPTFSQLLGWTTPLIASLKSINMPPACRALSSQLLDRCSSEKYSVTTRSTTFNTGLRIILQTMNALSAGDYKTISPASITDALEVVSYFMPRILEHLKGLRNVDKRGESAALSLQVVERALLLDCLVLRIEHEILKHQGQLGPERHARTAGLWQKITEAIGRNEQALASYALRGARELVGLERIVAKKPEDLSKDAKQFNNSFDALCGQVGAILDRINDKFSTEDLAGLFKSQHLATGPISILLLSDASARQSAVDLIKSMSSEVDRRDALASVFKSSYLSTMSALNEILQRITARKVFTPISIARRFTADIVDVLCDSQDGLLKTQTLDNDEKTATWLFWENVWRLFRTSFERTEIWGDVGYGKEVMMEFCRDTMQFAEQMFNSYPAFADSLGREQDKATADKLLEHPKEVMASMVKWIRLRDEYLINTIVTLVTGLLAKLGELDLRVSDEALAYIQGVIDKQIKTKLTPQQLAQLSRAVDEHTGEESSPPPVEDRTANIKKQGSINHWVKTGQAARDLDSERSDDTQKVIKSATSNFDKYKQQQALIEERRKKADAAAAAKRDAKRDLPAINKGQNQADFLKKRKAEKEAKEKAAADAKAKAIALRTVTAGSALQGLSNFHKEHTKGAGMMVDSDEDSSSEGEEDEFDRELFGTSKAIRRDRAVNGFEFDKTKVPVAKAPVKIKRMQRSVKDMRARLAPDLTKLHRTILGWNYYHEGKYPPGSDGHEYTTVPGKFRDPVQYGQIFQPLLLLEAWQSFVTAREEKPGQPYPIQIVSRGNVDMLIEVSAVLQHHDNKEQRVAEGDIVILSKQRMANPEEATCLARVHKIKRKKQALEVIYRVAPGNPLLNALTPNQTIHANKIQSITPLEREFGALQGLQYYDLCDYIVGGQPSHLLTYNEKTLNLIVDNYKLNRAQATAVQSALDNDAFTLIQGPPGTGKTKTIVAIVGALLSQVLRGENKAVAHTGYSNGDNGDKAPPKKLLVCAPSNAAVDELVMRMKDGVRTINGVDKKIKVVRLGRSEAINAAVQDVTLEELVNIKLHGQTSKADQKGDTQKLMNDHKAVSDKLREARDKEGTLKGAEASELLDEISALVKRKKELSTLIDNAKDKEGAANREADIQRKKAQQAVLDEAHVICATLSGSGHEMFQNLNIEFETVIVDEAAQCVEMSVLIPLKYGCAKCILVGDPKQLPPTVFSREAAEYQYEQSLFVRMQRNYPNEVHLLDTQYRMHPEISLFPSASFYDHRLLDGANMAEQRVRPWHQNSLFGPYWFFDVRGQETKAGKSLVNKHEIEVASQLYDKLVAGFGQKYNFKGKIGVITPYKSQLRELKSFFSNKYGRDIVDDIEFNTTDAFQGRESEIIIFSCVRASGTGIGFLKDIRRMNVGLTRAKSSLWVLGDTRTLSAGEYWGKLVEDARSRDRLLFENEYGSSLKNGTPLNKQHQPMTKKPQIKSDPNGKGIPSPAPNPADTSDSDSKRSVTVKPEPAVHREQNIKRESGTNRELGLKPDPSIKKESSRADASDIKKRKADFDDSEDTDMPDAPPIATHFNDEKSRSNSNSEYQSGDGLSGMFGAQKQTIRKRKVENGANSVFMKKPKVPRKEGQ